MALAAFACTSRTDRPEAPEPIAHAPAALAQPTLSPVVNVDPPVFTPITWKEDQPAVASDGTGYLVVWRDSRIPSNPPSRYSETQLFSARLSSTGEVLDPAGTWLTPGQNWNISP
ncbi:MAG TPA: hypothetical protein VND93_12810, partial [Myxococcales bacterium]|nr:hypothetical protein [Myxococcales bacterium]